LIHREEFTSDERDYYRTIIHSNVFTCLKTILVGGKELGISLHTPAELQELMNSIVDEAYPWDGKLTPNQVEDFKSLWDDKGVQEMFSRSAEYQLPDCASYYLNDMDRLAVEDYVPTDDDIIRSRVKTTGVIETKFEIEGSTFVLVDVGGQRSERRKWVVCFQDVTAVIFCVALSEYNLKCYEDNETNRMLESINLFKEIVNSKWFNDIPLILFLNKSDLLEQRIKEKVLLNIAFPDYNKDHTFENYVDFIASKFVEVIINQSKQIYQHVTCATSYDSVEAVWNAVQDIVLNKALDNAGLNM